MVETPQIYWYQGELIRSRTLSLAIDDPGFLYGATLFTTLRIYQQSLDHPLTAWSQHCDRLRFSLAAWNWPSPDWHQLRRGAEALLTYFPVLRLTLFPDGRELITGRFLPADLRERQQQGITAWLTDSATWRRAFPHHKTGNYLPNWLLLQAAHQQGATEAIVVDPLGNWLETCTGNLWGWRDGRWWTPPDDNILPGIQQAQLISSLISQNRTVRRDVWSADHVQAFEAIAYTNSVVELIPIHTVLSKTTSWTYQPNHPSFQELRAQFQEQGSAQS